MRDQRHPQHHHPEDPGEPYGNLNPAEDGAPRVLLAKWYPAMTFAASVLFVLLLGLWWWYMSIDSRGIG